MSIRIVYGTRGSETQEEAEKRCWAPACKYADKLFAAKEIRQMDDFHARYIGKAE